MVKSISTRLVISTRVFNKTSAMLILLGGFASNASAIAIDPSVSIQVTGAFDATNFGLASNASQSGT